MRGSIARRVDAKGKAGYFVVIEERADGGKRRRRWHSDPATGSAFTSRKAAEAKQAELVNAVNMGGYIEPHTLSVAGWLDQWLEIIRPTIRPSTWASYEKNVRLHIKPRVGAIPLRRLGPADLDALYAALLSGGRVDHRAGKSLSPRTVRYIHTIVGRALKDATRKGLTARNPAADADPPSATATAAVMRTWNPNEMGAFLEASQADERYGPVLAFIARTGCRRGEAIALRWQDVNLAERRASITRSAGYLSGKVVVGDVKTAAGRRSVALDVDTVAMLVRHRVRQAEQRLVMGAGWGDHDLVFADPTGAYAYPEGLSRAFVAMSRRLGLPSIRLHDLRHSWATLALQAGIHPKVVQERLGHTSVSITLGIYSHVAPTMHDDAASTVARLMRGGER